MDFSRDRILYSALPAHSHTRRETRYSAKWLHIIIGREENRARALLVLPPPQRFLFGAECFHTTSWFMMFRPQKRVIGVCTPHRDWIRGEGGKGVENSQPISFVPALVLDRFRRGRCYCSHCAGFGRHTLGGLSPRADVLMADIVLGFCPCPNAKFS